MSNPLCMCFAAAVLVMFVSTRIGEMPSGFALTSWKWVLRERLMSVMCHCQIDVLTRRQIARDRAR